MQYYALVQMIVRQVLIGWSDLTSWPYFTLVNLLFRCIKHSGNSAVLVCTINDRVITSCQVLESVCDNSCI